LVILVYLAMNLSRSISPNASKLSAPLITPAAFQPYGQVIYPSHDGKPYGAEDAQLALDQGILRFYIMRTQQRGLKFHTITRHTRCTQCLGSLGGKSWLIAVAPPGNEADPNLEQMQAFTIPGDCFIKLHVGTWHAGPYFQDYDFVDFYNLELADTNIIDHQTCNLLIKFNLEVEICSLD
jgi:ureidoglycolate hydrolase